MITKNKWYFFLVFAIIQPINGGLIVKYGTLGVILLISQIFWFILTAMPAIKFEE